MMVTTQCQSRCVYDKIAIIYRFMMLITDFMWLIFLLEQCNIRVYNIPLNSVQWMNLRITLNYM